MDFKNWLLLEKYMSTTSDRCAKCKGYLLPKKMTLKPRHIYNPGMLFSCRCTSLIWCNAVRNDAKLIEFLEGYSPRYTNGFCNDKFCGYCWDHLQPLQNGVAPPWGGTQQLDRFGCERCIQNQSILNHSSKEHREVETEPLVDWYRKRLDELKKLSGADND